MVNEPSVFELLRFDCTTITNHSPPEAPKIKKNYNKGTALGRSVGKLGVIGDSTSWLGGGGVGALKSVLFA